MQKMTNCLATLLYSTSILASCALAETPASTFADDVTFMQKHTNAFVLTAPDTQASIIVVPEMQGRVMTSSATGADGLSFGWINYSLIEEHKPRPHINAYGGEDRLWLGPEGGQFSIFFEKGATFDLAHWQTPALIDLDAYDVSEKSVSRAVFKKSSHLINYSGSEFIFDLKRTVEVLPIQNIEQHLSIKIDKNINAVAFQSINKLTNTGNNTWEKDSGLLSIWILGMFSPAPKVTVIVPYTNPNNDATVVNDTYFGSQPKDRLKMTDAAIFFKGDGKHRGKIGVSSRHAKNVMGAFDAGNKTLTIVQYNQSQGAKDYVNSLWEIQKEPYNGDVVNSYNDGPPAPGVPPLGPFYELETSSPAAALAPAASIEHIHRTFHFEGNESKLNAIAMQVLGVSLKDINRAFKSSAQTTGGK